MYKVISHRGCLNGPDFETSPDNWPRENQVWAIEDCIEKGHMVEVDLWIEEFEDEYRIPYTVPILSHDSPNVKDEVDKGWLFDNQYSLLVHAKNKRAVEWCIENLEGDWFCHDKDRWTGTKDGKLICYGKLEDLIESKESLLMMPEHHGIEPEDIKGLEIGYVCTDYVEKWENSKEFNG